MALTTEQLTALRDYINTIPEWAALPNDSSSAPFIAQQMDGLASPEFIVWRTSVSQDEIMLNGFDWARVDNLSVGKARIWEWMFSNEARSFNPSKPNVRAGIDSTWVGTQADLAVRASVYTHCKRAATVAEKVLASGQGTTENPATMGYEGQLNYADVQAARSL